MIRCERTMTFTLRFSLVDLGCTMRMMSGFNYDCVKSYFGIFSLDGCKRIFVVKPKLLDDWMR